jgi:guanosine-3',5'-bis(diphosphate) 3'-pyrophosphohydrolase
MSLPSIEAAIQLAALHHHGQRDKLGEPYIYHPLRVMLAVRGHTRRVVAVLHDTLEDTLLTMEDLRSRDYPDDVLWALDALTRRAGEDYAFYIRRCKAHPTARVVKLADLADHLSPDRIHGIDSNKQAQYRAAQQILQEAETTE